ncbi:hypothetical protein [Azospirillum canadense]|uniref:hypothetical protein n=1 Tax=Azospirillum canadense TaxID=403962 RepID=UPI0022275511|nr:hypothetical protein [Azospirillum canadense]MCW2237191.1 hypothetical protein [Azospirillum canadense]
MFRPITILGPVLALALVALSACSDGPTRRSSPAAGGPAPTASTASPGTSAPQRSLPATRPGTDDQSLRLGGTGDGSGDSCRVQCERSNNSCMDSVAARAQSGAERPDRMEPFTPSDNCQYQLRQCYQRCGAATR